MSLSFIAGRAAAVALLVLGASALARGVLIGVLTLTNQVPLASQLPAMVTLLVAGGAVGGTGWILAEVFGPEGRHRA